MLNPRILVLLFDIPDPDVVVDVALDALAQARRPYNVHFAASARHAAALEEVSHSQGAFLPGDLKFFPDTDEPAAVLAAFTDETHFLLLRGAFAFAPGWDATLLSRWRKIRGPKALMTAVPVGTAELAQAYLPALPGEADERGARIGAGLPVVCAAAPVRTLLIHPAVVFGPVAFLRECDLTPETLSAVAFAGGWLIYALDCAPLWAQGGALPPAWLTEPGPEKMPPTVWARFEQAAGFSCQRRTACVRASLGVFTLEDAYAQRLPFRLAARQMLPAPARNAVHLPLIVTAFIDLPDARRAPQEYLLRFSFLKALTRLPLTLYTGGAMERQLRAGFANTLAYPDNTLLPRALLAEGITPSELFCRNKFLLLQRTQRAYPGFTHFAWVNIDALPHPICPQAQPDFSSLMDDRLHVGWVDGAPDSSLMVVPVKMLQALVRKVQSITQVDTVLKRTLDEPSMLRRLLDLRPEWFTLHPMPAHGLLFVSCFQPELLSVPLAAQVAHLPDPIRVPPSAPDTKERFPHV